MMTSQALKPRLQRMIESPLISCIAGCAMLWMSFGIRQTFGVFLIPITQETGWDRSTFSVATALLQLLWGFLQPFIVYFAEAKVGFGKTIFVSCIFYAVGCFLLYASNSLSGLFIFGMGAMIGISTGGNSFSIVMASIGRRFPSGSKRQSIAFGIVSSFGSFGQVCFLPVSRAMLTSIGWRMSFIVFGVLMVAFAPLAFFLQSTPQKPPLMLEKDKLEEQLAVVDSKNIAREKEEIIEDYSAPDIKAAIVEALSSPAFILVTLGFSVCGFHVAFLMTHFPAYLQGQGINSSLAAWTISIIGLGSMIGTIIAGYLSSIIEPRFVLMGIFFVRAILIIIMVFIPLSVTTTVVFSVLFGPVLLSTVPVTTKFIGDVFGQKYLGTLLSLATVGHQIASFLGAYVAGVVYDRMHDYTRIWYGCLAASILAIFVNFFAGFGPIAKRHPNLKHS
ncbi:hypothetical protein G6F57_010832 [Rhizopus arrhizus]|uniref:Major facilitator superfamily (MFS) profile domain-containing protein n=1 Tax=Rhizopus oryzae TaxID=64495 RepID=A0A9P6X1J7_RHIOR|nr:hypothetical protein G6F24_010494 [Rhizopus arrhizus]KAG1402699.1 hypothetical protein G6F58_010513 [Rhizopus delemar]KAG0777426.1 hypothetical protein G6F22_011879 [Rhizopus arrhizus]KAG0783886.1 hypothetical protein G6F21_010255 [Rhizopus arrhizus]KAG0807066.1 hypothetical protein G6F20_010636 [Rhizopus arrhizus]